MALLANRISHVFDLRGPSITCDTACSSSLTAFHLACQSLWRGECTQAVVGGANIMLRPEFPIAMSKGQFLSPDGRCKTFDASADGYGRGEGAAVVIVKPLAQAQRDHDRIYAVVHGTGSKDLLFWGPDSRVAAPVSLPKEPRPEAFFRQTSVVFSCGTGQQAQGPAPSSICSFGP